MAVPVLACLPGAGCTSAANWVKPGTDQDRVAADLSDCQELTREETQRNYAIDNDIMASRGKDWRNIGLYQFQSDQISGDDADKSERILSSCMEGKGYSPAT